MDTAGIPADRKLLLDQLMSYIVDQKDKEQSINLNFICTHNSRRSHLGQIWAAVMADYYGVKDVLTFSGGTETKI